MLCPLYRDESDLKDRCLHAFVRVRACMHAVMRAVCMQMAYLVQQQGWERQAQEREPGMAEGLLLMRDHLPLWRAGLLTLHTHTMPMTMIHCA